MKRALFVILAFSFLGLLSSCGRKKPEVKKHLEPIVFISPLGKELTSPEPSQKMLEQYRSAKRTYENNPQNADNIIWYGRRTAYLGKYADAITIFSEGIKKFPKDARFYRHRGHRYISLRKFEEAIGDLQKAGDLIRGTANEIEPDGMPNPQNIPVSTLHGNIWYHLGLAHYLQHDYQKAYKAFLKCRASGDNADNLVSSTHWLYMIQRRLENPQHADSLLLPIEKDARVIENTSYYDLCKFYRGWIPLDSLYGGDTDGAASDAVKYGVANWYFYNENREKSKELMGELVGGNAWSSFGYIAAESDLMHYFNSAN